MAWAHVLAQSSAMGNPYEFREVMKAAFGFSDRTVDDVLDEQERRHAEDAKPGRRKRTTSTSTSNGTPKQTELDKLNALMASAKPRPQTTSE